jgi:endogenous inhibitor of DNA gyrase (YacG/DUF329 family)
MVQLPEIQITCRYDHPFLTRARGGAAVSCPVCRKAGKRVSVWVPKDRAATGRPVRPTSEPAAVAVPGSELAARWESVPQWDGGMGMAPARDTDVCPECENLLEWEPGRTLTWCAECKMVDLPPAVAGHYRREDARRSQVAIRDAPDSAALRSARVALRGRKDIARRQVGQLLNTVADDESYDRVQFARQAVDLAAMLRGYLPEIADAPDEDTLTAVLDEIAEHMASPQGQALTAEYQASTGRADEWERQQTRRAEMAAQERQQAEQAEREERARELAASRERKAITAGPPARTPVVRTPAIQSGYTGVAVQIAAFKIARDNQIAQHGACEFKHRMMEIPASRLFGIPARNWDGTMSGYAIANTPQYRACMKHYATAEAKLNQEGYSDVAYWEA